ncbi:ABC transporter substrate-binding protein [Propionicicella superfundia]|uniref:ABC transporter substrate-binding protein n=1 Tax=Propionicicella superfundia TaxID=348582 RepID=UPI00040FD008|nr:ABC transporter substrate-binding protein [Propionicicella superfundia]
MRNRRTSAVIALAAGAALLLSACAPGGSGGETAGAGAQRGGTLKIASVGDIDRIDPLQAYTAEAWTVARATTRQLVTTSGSTESVGDDIEIVPDLAKSWDVSADGLTYTFHLRDNAYFSGASTRKITADDFVYAIKRFADPNAQVGAIAYYNALLDGFAEYGAEFAKVKTGDLTAVKEFIDSHEISGVTATDDTTLVLKFTQPANDILEVLTLPFVSPLPEEVVSKYFSDSLEFRQNFASSGPYYISSYSPNNSLELKRAETYDAAADPVRAAYADTILIDTTVSSADAVAQQLQTGEADLPLYVRSFPATVISQYQQTKADYLHTSPGGQQVFLSINGISDGTSQGQKGLKELSVRQALSYAIDKSAVVKAIGGSSAANVQGEILNSTLVGHTGEDPYATTDNAGDPAKAKQLLEDAGFAGLKLNLAYRTSDEFTKIATSLQASLAKSGITVNLVPVPEADYWAFLADSENADQWDVALATYTPDWQGNSARQILGGWLDSDYASPGAVWGIAYDNPDLNAAVEKAFVAKDPEAAWQEANTIATKDLAWVPLLERVVTVPTSTNVTKWTWASLPGGADWTNVAVK